MRTRVTALVSPESEVSLVEMQGFLAALKESRRLKSWESEGDGPVPHWLRRRFSAEMPQAEKVEWLKRWRLAGPSEKEDLERRRGWEFAQWRYWFTDQNEFWKIASVTTDKNSLIVEVIHDDDPVPLKALVWTVSSMSLEELRIERMVGPG